jgi:hypothetical protein
VFPLESVGKNLVVIFQESQFQAQPASTELLIKLFTPLSLLEKKPSRKSLWLIAGKLDGMEARLEQDSEINETP